MSTANHSDDDADEQQLAEALRGGSLRAFEAVYRRYAGALYAYCFEAIRVRQDTEEVVHDVFMALWQGRAAIVAERGVGPLLYAIARRRRIDAFRRLVSSPVYEDFVDHQNTLCADAAPPMEYDDFVRTLRTLLAAMPEPLRQVVVMAKLQGLSNAEIAERLGVAEKTVRNRLWAALKELDARAATVLYPYKHNPTHK